MARTTYTELHDTLEALERATGVTPRRLGIAHANGRHCVVLDDGARDVSPWLTTGELRDWMWGAIKGAHLLRDEGALAGLRDEIQESFEPNGHDREYIRALNDVVEMLP